ncbi:MAG: RNA 2',3'-cyclic phosphodiesterase [Pseudomonadota bacterium]
MPRLFAALPIPAEIADRLTPLQKGVSGASWRPRENFHITLRFFDDLAEPVARDLDEELAAIEAPQMELSLEGVGWFGRREPHALWAGVAENDALRELSSRCERAARRVGLPPERRPFRPHVTLAYCHGTRPEAAAAFVERGGALRTAPFWADVFHLYSSHMGKGPSRYVAEADYPLGGVAAES